MKLSVKPHCRHRPGALCDKPSDKLTIGSTAASKLARSGVLASGSSWICACNREIESAMCSNDKRETSVDKNSEDDALCFGAVVSVCFRLYIVNLNEMLVTCDNVCYS